MLAQSKYQKITMDVIIPILVLIFLGVWVWIVLYSQIFSIKQVDCIADYKPCQNENLMAEVEKAKGQNIFLYKTESLSAKLKQSNYMIKAVEIAKQLPGTMTVSTQSINPSVAVAVVGVDNSFVICDPDGRVINVVNSSPNVPIVLVQDIPQIHVGQLIQDESIVNALKIALNLRDSNLKYSSISLVDSTTISIRLESGISALLATSKSASLQVAALQAILTDSTIKKESYHTIDVRFAQPVIR
ncbi:MAG: FtsQ-type POTRA domain-containing protein [bacterium]